MKPIFRGSLLFSALIFVFAQAACTGGRKTPPDTLVVGLAAAPASLDPRLATDANGGRIAALIFQSLVTPGADFKPAPEAAERWEYKNRVFTFFLKKDLKFHNGRAVTPDDILFSFEQFRAPKSPFAPALTLVENVEAGLEEGVIVVRLRVKSYSDKFLISDLPAVSILPKAETGPNFSKTLIGTGPYKFVSADANTVKLKSDVAGLPNLRFKIIRDDYTRYQKMIKGELDIVQTDMPSERVANFEKDPAKFRVLRYPGLSMTYLLVNFKDPLLKKLEARRALAQSLRREEIITHKHRGLVTEATSILTPANPYFNANLKNLPHKTGAKLSGRLVLKTTNQPQSVDTGRVLANQMSATGASVELQSFEWATFYDDVKKGNFQLALMKWVGVIDPDIYRLAFHSRETPPGRNRGSYANEKLDRLLDQSGSVENPAERRKLILEVQKMVHDDLVIIPLWYETQVAIARAGIRDYEPEMTGSFLPFVKVRKDP